MSSLLARIFGCRDKAAADAAYEKAMTVSDELLDKMRDASGSHDVARAVMADLWQQKHNVPFMTTVAEAVQEMKSGIEQKSTDR